MRTDIDHCDGAGATEFGRSQLASCGDIVDRMSALAHELRRLSDEGMRPFDSRLTMIDLASKLYAARRQTDKIFEMQGFSASPAWDIMLDLFMARETGRTISVTSAAIGAACPMTTALRWLQLLEQMGLLERRQDENDRRRAMISLTENGWNKMMKALQCHPYSGVRGSGFPPPRAPSSRA